MGERDSGTLKVLPFLSNSCDGVRGLTARQREIMELVVAGHPSKNIAADLRISQRTVENHRASIMRKTGSTSIPALVRFSLGAAAVKTTGSTSAALAHPE